VNLFIWVWWRLAKLQKITFKLPLWPHEASNPPETLWAFLTCRLLALRALVRSSPTLWLPHWAKGENRSYIIFKHKLLLGFVPDLLQTCYTNCLSKSMCHKVIEGSYKHRGDQYYFTLHVKIVHRIGLPRIFRFFTEDGIRMCVCVSFHLHYYTTH